MKEERKKKEEGL